MHDPCTLAFRIHLPWYRTEHGMRWWATFAEVWHVDPETDGTDDSCGWSRPRLSKELTGELSFMAGQEGRHPWLTAVRSRDCTDDPLRAECVLRGAIYLLAKIMHRKKVLRRAITLQEAEAIAVEFLHCPIDNIRNALCFLPGWHTNFQQEREGDRQEHAYGLYLCIARELLRRERRWYQCPRWHVHHWSIEFPWVRALRYRWRKWRGLETQDAAGHVHPEA